MRLLWLLVVAVLLVAPSTAAAATFNVVGTADVVGQCTGTTCPSIRAALGAAKDSPDSDIIDVPGGDYFLTEGVLTVDNPVTIRGESARVTTIIAGADRVFDVSPGVTAAFTRLTMSGGTAGFANGFFGGNLRNNGGNVLLDHVRVTDGSGHSGGGVSNAAGTMTIQYSLIDHNRAVDGGGDSGGIQNFGSAQTPGVLTVRDSTVAFNTARLAGGIFSWGNAGNVTTLQRVTVARNVGGDRGIGGIGSGAVGEPFHVSGSIIANNTVNGQPSNCGDPGPVSDGGNVVSNGDCEFTAAGDLQDTDPLIADALTDAGGETDLLTIASDSPARDNAGACDGTDQRDVERPQGAGCDAGAFEIEAVVQVNTDADHPVDKCEPSPGDCTLREAIADPELPEKIEVPAGVYELTQGELQITRPVNIVGADARLTRIGPQSEGTGRIFLVASGVDATIRAATVVGGDAGINSGGGILAEDGTSLHLIDSAVTGNVAAQGGGISSRGILELERTTVSHNFGVGASSRGGGIEFLGTQATLTNSTISGNTAQLSEGRGGGIYTTGNLVLRNVTIADNMAGDGVRGTGGGIFQLYAGAEVTTASNTLIARNEGGNCAGTGNPIQSSNGVSDEFPDPTCNAVGPGNQVVDDALIDSLEDNGGPTDTHALLRQSPAIDTGGGPCPAVDQRGIARPQRQACDVGAYEAMPGAEPVRLDGTPLDVWSDGVGRLQFRFDGEEFGVFFNPFSNDANAGLEIKQGDTHYRLGEGRLIVTPPEVTGQTMTSSYMVGPDLLVTEKITYADGSQDVDISYTIQNVSAQTVSFRAGELADLFVGGNDHGTGVYTDTEPRFIGGRSPSGVVSGLIERTLWSHFQESDYVSVFLNFAGGGLTDTFDTNLVDNGVGVEWERTLDPQQTEIINLTWRVGVASTVNTEADGDDGACTTAPGGCTLREALNYAQPGTAITVPAGTYTLDAGQLLVRDGISIQGAGAGSTTIVADAGERALLVSGANTAISGVRITGGDVSPGGVGGGILVTDVASLELVESTIDGNTAQEGGGIYSAGTLTILRSTISGNHAVGEGARGGGLFLDDAAASVTSSTLSGNTSTQEGGGIFSAHASLELGDVTVTANGAPSGGGIVHEEVPGGNDAVRSTNTIVAGNAGGACIGLTGNLIGTSDHSLADDASCFPTGSSNVVASAGLGPLADNGGPTLTHALLAGSAAIDAGGDTCQDLDQRRVTRPQGAACDIGAFERVPPAPQESQPTDTGGGGTTQPPSGGGQEEEQLPPPEANETVNVEPKSGTVKVRLKGTNTFVELTEGMQVPLGSEIDLRKGRLTLTAAADKSGGTATADFYGGIALVRQTKGAKPITRLTLTEKLACPRAGRATASARRKKKRRLWGDGSGRFRTEGSYSSATVRGTRWLTEDSCTSTLTRVVRGSVTVRDLVKKKTVIVKAGKKYVAKRKR